jgi:transcriptional regulator with XRE-family HTH domain
MQLDPYLRARGLTSRQFAEVVGFLTKQAIHNYRHGRRFPSPEILHRIREATKGQVTPEDFVDQHMGITAAPKVDPRRGNRSTAGGAQGPHSGIA